MFFDRIRDFYDEVVVAKKQNKLALPCLLLRWKNLNRWFFPRELLAVATQIRKRFCVVFECKDAYTHHLQPNRMGSEIRTHFCENGITLISFGLKSSRSI